MPIHRTFKEIRGFKGVWIPREIWLDENLTPLDKFILTEIDSLDNDQDNGCIASNAYLANFCQCNEKTITRSIQKLAKYKYIQILDYKNGMPRKIKTLVKMSRGGGQNVQGPQTKCPPINIDNNIDINKYNKHPAEADMLNSKENIKESKHTLHQEDKFEHYWEYYPNKKGKKDAYASYLKYIGEGKIINGKNIKLTNEQIKDAINNYIDYIDETNKDDKYIMHGSTFFNSGIFDYL